MDTAARLLIVDDDAVFAASAAELAAGEGCEVVLARDCAEARSRLRRSPLDLVLLDLDLPDGSGLDLLDEVDPVHHGRVVVLTGCPSLDSAVRACAAPVAEYLLKPLDPERWLQLVRESQPGSRQARNAQLMHTSLIGRSPALREAVATLLCAAPSPASVLITGEAGTGKELAARTLHHASHRMGPFVPVDCASMTAAQLPGPELLRQAEGGTLFLDEPCRLPAPVQAALVRVLEAATFPSGKEAGAAPPRLVSASSLDPRVAMAQGQLREDLYYRLAEVPVHLAPLRERDRDAILLARVFIDRLNARSGLRKRLASCSERVLARHLWPGNVRELQAAVQRAYALDPGPGLVVSPLQRDVPGLEETPTSILFTVGMTMADVERRMLLKTLEHHGQDRTATARALGISVRTVHNHLARLAGTGRRRASA